MRPQWSEKSEPNKVGLCNHFCSHMHMYNPRISNLLAKILHKSYRIYLATVHDSIVFLKFVLYSTLRLPFLQHPKGALYVHCFYHQLQRKQELSTQKAAQLGLVVNLSTNCVLRRYNLCCAVYNMNLIIIIMEILV